MQTQEQRPSERLATEEAMRFERPYAYRCWVPSQGFLYGGKFPGGECVLAPITAGDEKILAQKRSEPAEVIDILLQRCLVHLPVRYQDLLMADTFSLLLQLRTITYGSEYRFRLHCPACSMEYQHEINLPGGLELLCLAEEDDCEPYSVKLPVGGDEIQFRLLRNRDEADVRRYARQQYGRSMVDGDPAYVYRLCRHLTSVNGKEQTPLALDSYVNRLVGADSLALRRAIEARDFGPRLLLQVACPACGKESEERMPFDKEFFRPERVTWR